MILAAKMIPPDAHPNDHGGNALAIIAVIVVLAIIATSIDKRRHK